MKRGICFTAALFLAVSANAAEPLNCASLAATLSYPDTVFTASSDVPAGTLQTAGQPIGAHCLLRGRMGEHLSPVDGKTYSIGFEMRLPLDWNRRYFYQANGGIDGAVVTATGNTSGGGPLTSALLQGFAVISSDAGHNGAQNPTFGLDPQARLDYGYQAVGKLTPMAKAVIRAAYGHGPKYSYIGGCSNGGRHAMVAAARYPEQYDGFLVGSPGFNLPKAAVANIYGAQQYATVQTTPDLGSAWTTQERQLVSSRVLARCDTLDGLADGIVQSVEACQKAFDLDRDVPTCPGARDGTCLSAAQKVAIGNIFAGPKDRHGRPMYSTFPYDAGHGAGGTVFWEFLAPLLLDSGAVGFVFGTPPQDPATFNGPVFSLTSDVDTLYRSIFAEDRLYRESGMEFMTPPRPTRLHGLQRSGGRMIVYHGVSDPIFSVDDTTRWYEHLHGDRDRGDRDFVRLFHVPGMNHCSGGPATDQFDMLGALVAWVEKGREPERVTAGARGAGNPGGVNADLATTTSGWAANRTRPLCAYPRVAVYKGGDPESAASFECRAPRR
jgi:pimeloyl-ACP methyl ester carboxylesterase